MKPRTRPLIAPILTLSAFLALLGFGAAPTNLLRDGDFERKDLAFARGSTPGAWTSFVHTPGDAALTLVEKEGRAGSRCARYIKTDPAGQNVHLDQIIPVARDTVYSVSAWMRSDGGPRPLLSVQTVQWKSLGEAACDASGEWRRVRLAFHSFDNDRVRIQWFPGAAGEKFKAVPGTAWFDDVTIERLDPVPPALAAAFALARAKPGDEIDVSSAKPGPVGRAEGIRPITCRDGVLVYPDGAEVALWGVNFQTALSWEYNGRLKSAGVPLDATALKLVSDRNLEEVRALGSRVIRLHLCPADFSDGEGNVRNSVYLDVLDHLLARCQDTGTYVYLTLVNDMNARTFPDSFIVGREREEWLFDTAFVAKTDRYIRAILSRENRYSHHRYADDPAIAVIEIMNEPDYPDWPDLAVNPKLSAVRAAFETWNASRGSVDFPGAAFPLWRHDTVRAYLDRMCAAIRATGAKHPIVWNLNWPAFIRDHEDVFQAVAESPVDGVSFCLYPGQQDVPHPFWAHPTNLDGKNYLPFLRDNYAEYDRLRWLLGARFAHKAKVVYEFETFYTQNSHLYPAMARLFRALGAQIAPMWTYSLTPSAERLAGSHHLNLYCTPQKAASFAIASEVFSRTPRLAPYPASGTNEVTFDGCLVSFSRNISVFQTPDTLMHSRPIGELPFGPPTGLRHILACGASPLVAYEGTGIYRVDISDSAIDIVIHPDSRFILPHWQRPPRAGATPARTCELDPDARHPFALRLPGWTGPCRIARIDGETKTPVPSRGTAFEATPGRYRIERSP